MKIKVIASILYCNMETLFEHIEADISNITMKMCKRICDTRHENERISPKHIPMTTSIPNSHSANDKPISAGQMESRGQAFVHLLYPLYNDYYQTLSTRSVSANDVRITRSSPTPTNSSGVSSCGASVGDISTCSAPTPPLSALSSGQNSPCLSAAVSPETKRRQWRKKWMRVRDDLDGLCQRMKASSLNDECGLDAESATENPNTPESRRRTLKVEFEDDRYKAAKHIWLWTKRGRKHHGRGRDDMDLSSAYHFGSPTLALKAIENSIFHAEVSLTHLPAGNITLRINDYRLLIIVTKQCLHNGDHDNSPIAYGEVQLPIYVRPSSLHFDYVEDRQALIIVGRAKSYGISVSSIDLRSSEQLSPKNKRKGVLETIYSTDVPNVDDDVYSTTKVFETISKKTAEKPQNFRSRSYTK